MVVFSIHFISEHIDKLQKVNPGLLMAYIPPHKRHLKDDDGPLPTQFEKNMGSSSTSKSRTQHSKDRDPKPRICIHMQCAISKWFIETGDDDQFPAGSFRLVSTPANRYLLSRFLNRRGLTKNMPWVSITEKIRAELLASFANMRSAMDLGEAGGVAMKPTFVAKTGRIRWIGPSVDMSSCTNKSEAEAALAHVGREFCPNLPDSYMEAILGGVGPKIVADFYQSKEYYRVYVSDKGDPNSEILIECRIISRELKIHKIKKNEKRCFRADVTCLDKLLDLRLMLSIKRDLTAALNDDFEELKGLKHLVDSAILDGNVKGGLRWPLGKEHYSDGRYSVIAIQHTTVKTFKNSSLKLRVINAYVFDFNISDGQVINLLILDMKGIRDMLIDRMVDMEPAIGILEETLNLVWNHMLF